MGIKFMLYLGWLVTITSGVTLLLGYYVYGLNVYAIVIPVAVAYYGISFIWPNIFSIAVTPFGHIAAYAGAAYAFVQFSGGVVFAAVFSYLGHKSQLPLAWCFMLGPIMAFGIFNVWVGNSLKLCNNL